MDNLFLELTIILIGAGVIAYGMHFFKQPSIIAYIVVGLIIGPLGFYQLHHGELLKGLSEIGITLLLFMVGLDLDISQLKRIGKAAVIAGIGQVVFTCLVGFGLINLLGINSLPAWYIAIALTFSSTIIVVKLLSEKKDLQSLYGKLAIGIFLIQDVAAIFILIFLSGFTNTADNPWASFGISGQVIITFAKAFIIGLLVIWVSKYVFPKILKTIQVSDELVLLFALGWSLGLASVFSLPIIGFNAAIGGFVAGLALANSGVHHRMSGRVKSLRDFFIIIFFIFLGSQLVFSSLAAAIIPAIVLSLFVLIGNPLIVMLILGLMGYKPRVSFMTGVTVAQISEFSLILIALGLSVGHVNDTHVTIVTLVGITTIALSSYGILYAEKMYSWLSKFLQIFDFHKKISDSIELEAPQKDHIIMIGANRMGSHILESLQKQKKDIAIIDYNPDVIHEQQKDGYYAICGDITDPYVHELVNLEKAKMIISTIPGFKDTMAVIEYANTAKKRIKVIVTAEDEVEAAMLYKAGADYVLLAHYVGGLHLANIISTNHTVSSLNKLKKQHLKSLTPHHHH